MPLPPFSENAIKGRVAETIIQELFLAPLPHLRSSASPAQNNRI